MQFNTQTSVKNKKERAIQLLELVDIKSHAKHKLSQMSGGQQQRVAIALALANYPALLLADEPTGSVDSRTSDIILDVFRRVNKELGTTVVIVTHDREISKKVERVVAIRDGKTASEFIMSYSDKLAGIGDFLEPVELAVLDRAGRVQIPKELLEKMGLDGGNRLKIHIDENNRVILENPN